MIHLSADEKAIVQKILRFYAPDRRVVVFGSRASGIRLKPHSDIDLCVMGDAPLDAAIYRQLRDAFSISDLPMRVDIVNWSETSALFRQNILEHHEDISCPP